MSDSYKDLVKELTEGTDFSISSDVAVLSERPRIRFPVEALNCIFGGGIPFGTIMHTYGPSKSGKSTICYLAMAEFQKQYPDGVCAVIDSEASSDGSRLKYFGIDLNRVLRLPATSLEAGFIALNKMLDNKEKNKKLKGIPVFCVYDSLSGKAQDDSANSRMNAMDRARVIKSYLGPLMSRLEKHDFILCLINQIVNNVDRYGNQKESFGGGASLLHFSHISLHLHKGDTDYINGFAIRTNSSFDVEKTKISPEIMNIPLIIDVTDGGKTDEVRSFCDYMYNLGYIVHKSNSSKYNIEGFLSDKLLADNPTISIVKDFSKEYRNYTALEQTVKDNKILYDAMRYLLMVKLTSIYGLQKEIIDPYMAKVRQEIIEELPEDNLTRLALLGNNTQVKTSEEDLSKYSDESHDSERVDQDEV